MGTSLFTPILRLQTGPLAGKVIELGNTLRVGRHPYNEMSLEDRSVSRYHCWIRAAGGGFAIEDLASANGTWVNGVRVLETSRLQVGDRVRVGETEFLLAEEE